MHKFVASFGTHQNSYRRIVVRLHNVVLEIRQIEIHLRHIVIFQTDRFQVDEHVALQNAIVENKVAEVVFVIDKYAFLACLEAKACAQFEYKFLKVVDKSLLKFVFLNYFGVF